MSRYFLIILLAYIPFFANSQDTLVQIRPEVARFFLEQNEKVKIHENKDSLQEVQIKNLREALNTKDEIIQLYELDEVYYDTLLSNHEKIEENLNKEIKRQKRLKYLGYSIAIVVILLSI